MVAGQLKTIYKVGKGYLDEDEAPADEAPGDEVSVARRAGESSAAGAGKDDSGEGVGAELATDGGPKSGAPEPVGQNFGSR